MRLLKRAILNTLSYSDIFDFPLKEEEIWKYLISEALQYSAFNSQFQTEAKVLKNITFQEGFFCFKGREDIIKKRKQRLKISEGKILFAKKIAKKIAIIPTIDLIAVSGSLAMHNAEASDDIDFFIISKKNTIWITRLIVIILLEVLGVRRRKKEKSAPNKICLNMFMDKKNLTLPTYKQTNYSAHEIVQMETIFNRGNTYQQFIVANNWIRKFLPNAVRSYRVHNYNESLWQLILFPLEYVSKIIQKWYSQKDKTKEVITDAMLAFHPIDRADIVEKQLRKVIKRYTTQA